MFLFILIFKQIPDFFHLLWLLIILLLAICFIVPQIAAENPDEDIAADACEGRTSFKDYKDHIFSEIVNT